MANLNICRCESAVCGNAHVTLARRRKWAGFWALLPKLWHQFSRLYAFEQHAADLCILPRFRDR